MKNIPNPVNFDHFPFYEQNAAVSALKHFAPAYLVIEEYCLAVTSKYLDLLSDANAAVRRGCGLALGVLPCQLLATRWTDVIKILCSACSIEVHISN